MKLMTCCSCDGPPCLRLLSAAGAVGARGSATGQTETQGLRLFWEVVWCRTPCLLSHQPLYTTTRLFPQTPYHQHTRNRDALTWRHTDSIRRSIHQKYMQIFSYWSLFTQIVVGGFCVHVLSADILVSRTFLPLIQSTNLAE